MPEHPAPTVERDGAVCRISFAEPAKRNPLSPAVLRGLEATCDELADDLEVRVVVLAGGGKAFSAGADLRPAAGPQPHTWRARRHEAGRWQRVLDAWERLPQVTVAALHGPVVGGAALLAMACDLRVAATDLAFSIPELALGIPLTWAGLPRLVREIGMPRTRDLVMTGRVVGAAEALSWGVATMVVPESDLAAKVDEVVTGLIAQPDEPLAMTKDALAAIGRLQANLDVGWADADLLWSSQSQPESRAAAQRYMRTRLRGPPRNCSGDVDRQRVRAVPRDEHDERLGCRRVRLDVDLMRRDVDEVTNRRIEGLLLTRRAECEPGPSFEDVNRGFALAVVVHFGSAAGLGRHD